MLDTVAKKSDDQLSWQGPTDRDTLSQLYERHYERIFRFCVHRLFSRETAEDVTSEVFLNVARKIRSFKGSSEQEFCNWLYGIATNLTNACLRKTIRRNNLLAAAVEAERLGREKNDPDNPGISWSVLYQAISQLKPRYQTIITLRFFEKLTYEQIAVIMNIKPVTVRVTLTRALGRLRKILQPVREGDV